MSSTIKKEMPTRTFSKNNTQQKEKDEPFRENFKNADEEDLKNKSVLDSLEEISADGAKEIYEIMTTSEPFKQYSQMLEELFKLVPQDNSNVTDFGPGIGLNEKTEFTPNKNIIFNLSDSFNSSNVSKK